MREWMTILSSSPSTSNRYQVQCASEDWPDLLSFIQDKKQEGECVVAEVAHPKEKKRYHIYPRGSENKPRVVEVVRSLAKGCFNTVNLVQLVHEKAPLSSSPSDVCVLRSGYRKGQHADESVERECRAYDLLGSMGRQNSRIALPKEILLEGRDTLMPYFSGGELLDFTGNSLEKLHVLRDFLEGLSELHEAGLVHHDVKPSAVLINENKEGFLSDLGEARPSGDLSGISSGTYFFFPPEICHSETALQKEQEIQAMERKDAFAAGVTLYLSLVSKDLTPFEGGGKTTFTCFLERAKWRTLPHPIQEAIEQASFFDSMGEPKVVAQGNAELKKVILGLLHVGEAPWEESKDSVRSRGRYRQKGVKKKESPSTLPSAEGRMSVSEALERVEKILALFNPSVRSLDMSFLSD